MKGHALRALRQVLSFGAECEHLERNPAEIKAEAPSQRVVSPFTSCEEVLTVAGYAGGSRTTLVVHVGNIPEHSRSPAWYQSVVDCCFYAKHVGRAEPPCGIRQVTTE
jgi:hypothetical protein